MEGDKLPAFNAITSGSKNLHSADFKKKVLILYFYPKDDTTGCTKESLEFAEQSDDFKELGATIIGISRDSVERHDKFKKKYNLPFDLISDEDGSLCDLYGTWKEKKNYGRTYMGIERSTFLINKNGIIVKIWRKVRVKGHVDAVMEALKELQK